MNSIRDVEMVLASKKNNLTARRWSKDPEIKNLILEMHNAWNNDHIKIGELDALMTLEENIDTYLDRPVLIDTEKSSQN
ncbi:hypothetical protein ACQKDB_16115 [Planococcus kocurii]|uniref:hypothetical protein n=1 Tax=Planococcus kocurii TaxID=1374 RepID=UPI003D0580EE